MDRTWVWAPLQLKAIDTARRVIRGTATTPAPDRQGDIFEPLGATFPPEIPLLLHHQITMPVGVARLERPTADGITFEAELPHIDTPGAVKDEVDRAWTSIQHQLIRGVSIGFRAHPNGVERLDSGGRRYAKSEILELSLVTVPAHQGATFATIKSLDLTHLAASGQTPSGVADPISTKKAMTIQEQITQFEQTRTTKAAKMTALMTTAATDNVTLDAAQTDEYDGLAAEVKAIDAHLVRLKALEQSNITTATPVTPVTKAHEMSEIRGGATPIVQVKALVPKGTAFTRYCQALAYGRGDTMRALEFAKQWESSTPEVGLVLKAAVAPGTSTDAAWAGPLVQLKPLVAEFLELLRPATILGKIPNLRRVPFNISIPAQTLGGTYNWVGQGAPKPVTALGFSTQTLTFAKCAGIIVITQELARFSSPSAEALIQGDMIAGMAQFLDKAFMDPTKAAVAGVSPGSITNGVTPITTTGTTPANARQDIVALLNAIAAANLPVSQVVLIMSETNALVLTAALNPLGQPLFPDMGVNGGTIQGIKVVTSQTVGNNVIACVPEAILMADDGGVNIDMSMEASVQMSDAPDNPAVATTVLTSFWQNNLLGLRAERFINWKVVRTAAVQYTVASYS